ncbi:MAG: hypothetical protein FJ298_03615 [Planctomycetes bacterium]|nr:hypothetical protein [Planctomycetota bacterium]
MRIASEACFDAYIARRQIGEAAAALFAESEALLLRALEAAPKDPWPSVQLANLYQWEGRDDGALELLARAVELDPANEALHTRLAALMRSLEGPESVASFYASLCARLRDAALPHWFAAQELFELAVPSLAVPSLAAELATEPATEPATGARFERAESFYRRCRELEPSYASACTGFEVMCRAGAGWTRLRSGELEAAERMFRSMEELFPGGLEWRLEGRVRSGVEGLQFVADRWLRGAADSLGGFEVGAASKAARIYAFLHAYRPSDADFANNAGFFHREWGVGLVTSSREHRAIAAAVIDPAVRDLELALAERTLAQARDVLAKCRDAYLAAASLAPQDVRVTNDAALILVYHFPSRIADAERLLLAAVERGAEQKDSGELPSQALDLLIEAWGDAHQNLGVLELVHRGNPVRAREWFAKSVAIGPRPRVGREWVAQVALPACDLLAQGHAFAPEDIDPRIALLE